MALSGAERTRRYEARKRGEDVPDLPRGVIPGYKQTPEHIAKRIKSSPENHRFKGDAVSAKGGRRRAERLYPDIGPCSKCGNTRSERHHRDGNTANNEPSNIVILCRRCHMQQDGRLDAVIRAPGRGSSVRA